MFLSNTLDPFRTALVILGHYWWVYTPIFLFFLALENWLIYVRQKYLLSLKWALLEIKPPPDVQKSPKIAENIFSGLHAVYAGSVGWKDRFFKGEVQKWFSLEIIGDGGNIAFYVRTPEDLRDLVEAQIFAQYPEAEIKLVEDDYVNSLPLHLPDNDHDLFGTELIFDKPDAYPIKTYPFFEEESGKDEFKRTDPLAPLAEIMSSLDPGEHIWLQLLIRGTGDEWVKKSQAEIDKIISKEPKRKEDALDKVLGAVDSLLFLGGKTGEKEEKKEKQEFSPQKLTGGQKFVLEQVENKIAKLGFKSGYRFLYIARKELFRASRISSVVGMFKQVYSNNLNSFKPNKEVTTKAKGWFSWFFPSDKGFFYQQQEFERKWHIYQNYKKRAFVARPVILNTEELATLFHLPGIGVKAPALPRVEAKRGTPPTGLPGINL